MKALRTQPNSQRNITETSRFGKHIVGPKQSVETHNNFDSLALALEFGEAMLASAVLLCESLVRLSPNADHLFIRENLKLAQGNFEAFRARAASYPERGEYET
jgi:hypothetical protein